MPITDATWAERQQRYWEVEGQQSATDQLGRTCTYILICQVAFVGLDWLAFPSQFVFFFLLRLIVDAFVLLVLRQKCNRREPSEPLQMLIES